MKRIIRFSVWVLFVAVVALTVTSYKVTAQNGTGACANCGSPNGRVEKCNGFAAETAGDASGNCIAVEGKQEAKDLNGDGVIAPDENVNCTLTKFYTCQAGSVGGGGDQGCGLMQACGGQ